MAPGAELLAAPHCTVVGGPNGSGKSSIYAKLKPIGEFVNADVAAKAMLPSDPAKATSRAARQVLKRLDQLLERRIDFTYETTLSSRQSLAVMKRAKAAGYVVSLVFVAVNSPDLNVLRVAERVGFGGHDIPETDVRRRYDRAFDGFAEAVALADGCLVYDNSGSEPLTALRIDRGVVAENNLDDGRPLHVRIASSAAKSIDMSEEASRSRRL